MTGPLAAYTRNRMGNTFDYLAGTDSALIPPPLDSSDLETAAACVHHHANSAADELLLLAMLGLPTPAHAA